MNQATATIQDEITNLQTQIIEAKGRGEFEYAFLLLDKIHAFRDPILCPGDGCEGCFHCHSDSDDQDNG